MSAKASLILPKGENTYKRMKNSVFKNSKHSTNYAVGYKLLNAIGGKYNVLIY